MLNPKIPRKCKLTEIDDHVQNYTSIQLFLIRSVHKFLSLSIN